MVTSRSSRSTSRAGFTLIELLIVLVMISIILGIAMWKVDIAHYQINGDMQVVGSALIASQRQAIAKQHNVIVVFDQTGSVMRIISDDNNNGRIDAGESSRTIHLGDRVRYGLGTAPAMSWGSAAISFTGVEISSGLPALTFYRNGSASESKGVYLCSTRALIDADVRERRPRDPRGARDRPGGVVPLRRFHLGARLLMRTTAMRRGFSLAEILVALVILSVIVMGLASTTTTFLHETTLDNVRVRASTSADTRIAEVEGWPDYSGLASFAETRANYPDVGWKRVTTVVRDTRRRPDVIVRLSRPVPTATSPGSRSPSRRRRCRRPCHGRSRSRLSEARHSCVSGAASRSSN